MGFIVGASGGGGLTAAQTSAAVLDEALDTDYDTLNTLGGGAWRYATKTVTFTGAAGAGAQGTVTLFTVTGDVSIARYSEKCTTNVVGAGTLQTGWSGDPNGLMAATADATTIDAGEWNDCDGGWVAGGALGLNAEMRNNWGAPVSSDIIMTIGTADLTGGVIVCRLFWRPLSAGATLVAA